MRERRSPTPDSSGSLCAAIATWFTAYPFTSVHAAYSDSFVRRSKSALAMPRTSHGVSQPSQHMCDATPAAWSPAVA